jgi:hypothetical protein
VQPFVKIVGAMSLGDLAKLWIHVDHSGVEDIDIVFVFHECSGDCMSSVSVSCLHVCCRRMCGLKRDGKSTMFAGIGVVLLRHAAG